MRHANRRAEPIRSDLENLDLDLTEIAWMNNTSESVVRSIARQEGIDVRTRSRIHRARQQIRGLEEQIETDLDGLHKQNH